MSAVDDTEVEKANWHWRNSMRPVRFINMDARAAWPWAILLVYFRPITLILAISITAVFIYLERRGLTYPAALRALRVWLIGADRPAWYSIRRRRLRDFG